MRKGKGTENRIALVGMCDEIYVREDKGTENRIAPFTSNISISVERCVDDSLLKKAF